MAPHLQCGKGCIEVLASGTAIARRTRERLAQSPELGAQIMKLAGGDPFAIRSGMIGKAGANPTIRSRRNPRADTGVSRHLLGNTGRSS